MGDTGVGSMLLADTATSAQRFVAVFVGVYVLLIFAYIIASWVPAGTSPTLERVRQFLYDVCEPYLRIFRRVIPPIGPLDVSPIIAVIVLYVLERIVNTLIGRIL
jgi:YggT family protein